MFRKFLMRTSVVLFSPLSSLTLVNKLILTRSFILNLFEYLSMHISNNCQQSLLMFSLELITVSNKSSTLQSSAVAIFMSTSIRTASFLPVLLRKCI